MEAFSKSRIDGVTEAQECWNAFFSSLAFAEQAAGQQCRAIAADLQKQGDPSLAALYTELAAEEDRHFALVKRVCQKLEEPSGTARRVYSGEWMSEAPSTIERANGGFKMDQFRRFDGDHRTTYSARMMPI